jgi:hypothetical protein
MTIVEHNWSALPEPYAIGVSDRIRETRAAETPMVEIDV